HDPPVYPEGDVLPALDTKQTCRSVNGASAFGSNPENIYSFSLTASELEDRVGRIDQPALLEREDCTVVACYRSLYAPRTVRSYVSKHRTAGIAGRARWRAGRMAARAARAATVSAGDRFP